MAQCDVETCDRPVRKGGRGWCNAHYMRWYQTGDVRPDVPLRMHNVDPVLRFWPKVNKAGPVPEAAPRLGACWVWLGHIDRNGYALFKLHGTNVLAHRFSYQALVGDIADGLEIDHLCRRRCCIRPDHLQPVTHLENMSRSGPAQKTRCSQGHPLAGDNIGYSDAPTRRGRFCRECARRRSRECQQRRRDRRKQERSNT